MQGTLDSGSTFDTSRQEGRGPLPFVLGQNRVIQGNLMLSLCPCCVSVSFSFFHLCEFIFSDDLFDYVS